MSPHADKLICPNCRRDLIALGQSNERPLVFKCEYCTPKGPGTVPMAVLYTFIAFMVGLIAFMVWSRSG